MAIRLVAAKRTFPKYFFTQRKLMDEILIRKAESREAAILADLIAGSHLDVAQKFNLTPQNCPKHPSNCEDDWIKNDFARGVTYFLLDYVDEPVGCIAIERANQDQFYLERLSVLPGYRHRGFGKVLVDHVLNLARTEGAALVGIGTIAEHTLLTAWYQKLGFLEKETKVFPHIPFTVLFMKYAL
jgi:diamine N-acetyltransferase